MELQVIGAGFPRTGTTSLKASLEALGYEKCHHMKELFMEPDTLPYWKELKETGSTDFDTLFDGFRAAVDFPAYPFYKELMDRYPDASVILTVRDFDAWYESAQRTIRQVDPKGLQERIAHFYRRMTNAQVRKAWDCVRFFKQHFWKEVMQGRFEDKAFAREVFQAHIERVKAEVPSDRLLVYDVKEGWGPLCEFLGKSVPEGDFPELNKKENFNEMLKMLLKGSMN
jgi:hypothetical protein